MSTIGVMAKHGLDKLARRFSRATRASDEPTLAAAAPATGSRDTARAAASLAVGQPPPTPDGQRRTGIVWVHGIGTQKPGESLFDWTHPVLDVLAEWRRERDDADPGTELGENPVNAASVSDPDNRWILVDIPTTGSPEDPASQHDPAQWLFTEAYWAGDIRPPTFAAASAYLLGRLTGIVQGIATGYGYRETARRARLARLATTYAGHPDIEELSRATDPWWRLTDLLDAFWQLWPVRGLLLLFAIPLSVAALAVYAALHAIPIEAVRKRVQVAAADTFIIEWFADLAVILDDLAQSAAVRTRLLERVNWLRLNGCVDIVLLAHSGGTIVSFASLLRFSHAELPVSKLVTFGEAIKLGWRLEQDVGDWRTGNSVRGDLVETHPNLRWVDIWGTYDPAPSGPMAPTEGSPLLVVDKLSRTPRDCIVEVESRPVTNFMSLAADHGGYWSNDEGFLIPLIRHIDDPNGNGDGSRFYGDELRRTLRTERRRRRVALLLGWRWAAFVAAVAALAGLAFGGVTSAAATGGWIAQTFSLLPGHELVSGSIDGVGKAISVILTAIGGAGLVAQATQAGASMLGGLVIVAAIYVVYGRGTSSWTAHDAIERRAIRGERLGPAGTATARGEAVLLVGGLVALVVAAWLGTRGITIAAADPEAGSGAIAAPFSLVALAVAAIAGFIGRGVFGPRRSHGTAAARVDAMVSSGSRRD